MKIRILTIPKEYSDSTSRMKNQAIDYVGLQGYACGGSMKNKFDLGGLAWVKNNHPEIKNPEAVAKALEKMMQGNRGNFYRDGKWNFDIAWGNMTHPKMFTSNEDAFNQWVKYGLDRKTAFDLSHKMPVEPKNSDLKLEYQRKINERNKEFERLVTSAERSRGVKYKDKAGNLHATREEAVAANDAARRARIAAQQSSSTQNSPKAAEKQTVAAGSNKGYTQTTAPATQETQTGGSSGGSGNASKIGNVPSNLRYGNGAEDINDGFYTDDEEFTEVTPEEAAALTKGTPDEEEGIYYGDDPEAKAIADSYGFYDGFGEQRGIEYNPYPTWMRYAPAVGAGIMSLTDALGLTNKPDYTYANKLEAAANQAAYAPHIETQPIGDYMTYRPLDRLFYANQLNGQSLATQRMLMNTNSPSKAANLLAHAYNTMLANGTLYRQGEEYNDKLEKDVATFNRGTNMFNSQMGLEAAMANARYTQQAKQLGLSGLGQAAALRDSIDSRVGAARSANITNFLNSLGDIGRENFAMNMINDDDAYQYGITGSGTTPFKRTAAGKKKSRWRFGV